MQDDPKLNNDNKQELDFEFEELEARIAPSVMAACGGCTGCSQPGCSTCAATPQLPA